jgi:hypothetical protein
MITQGKDMLIKSGLIMKSRSVSMFGRKDNGAHLARGEAKKEEFSA